MLHLYYVRLEKIYIIEKVHKHNYINKKKDINMFKINIKRKKKILIRYLEGILGMGNFSFNFRNILLAFKTLIAII